MYKKILLSFFISGFVTSLQAQKMAINDVPAAVIMAFKKANPTASNPEWKLENSNYQARYLVDKKPRTVTYSRSGTIIVHDSKVAIAVLPPQIKVYLDKNYPNNADAINKVIKITKPDGTVNYDIEINGSDLLFDANGKFLKAQKK